MLADGGETISDLAVLRDQPQLFGEVASLATAWRTLEAIDDAALARIASARAAARRQAWSAGADPGFYVIDIDATLVTAHSEKEQAAPTYKRGFGFHPLMAFLDATGEALAAKLRPGNAGSGTATDHVEVLDAALAQLPVDPTKVEVIARLGVVGALAERDERGAGIRRRPDDLVREKGTHRHWCPLPPGRLLVASKVARDARAGVKLVVYTA